MPGKSGDAMAYDPVDWRQRLDALLTELPDADAAKAAGRAVDRALQQATKPTGLPVQSADDILTATYPDPVWAVPGLLPAGLAILAGRPKLGKSWLALQIAQAVAAGGFALGQRVRQSKVCYLALEDAPRRLQERMRLQCWPTGLPAHFVTLGSQLGDLRNGGGDALAKQTEQEGYRLVVIDTLSRALGNADQNDVGAMTAALAPLQETAHRLGCCVLMLDHHHKMVGNPDAISDILGSTGKGAVADTALGLYRERGKIGAKLSVTGRDVEERTLDLVFDRQTGCWQLADNPTTGVVSPAKQEILDALADLGDATLVELATATGKDKGYLHKALADLVNLGLVVKTRHCYKAVAP